MNMIKKGIIILTSTGLSAEPVRRSAVKYFDTLPLKSVVIITTAAEGKENNKYSKLAETQFKELNFSIINFVDIEINPQADFSKYNVMFVCGGNTFKLMKFARQVNFDKDIKSLLERGGVYIGVSAGSLIVGPSIQIANEIHPDKNDVSLVDFNGFNIVNFIIFPHYSSNLEEEIKSFEKRNNAKIERIDNSQAIIIEDGKKTLI